MRARSKLNLIEYAALTILVSGIAYHIAHLIGARSVAVLAVIEGFLK